MLPRDTERLSLRDFVAGDLPDVHGYCSDREVTRYLPWGPFDEAATRAYLDRAAAMAAADPRVSYVLGAASRDSGRVIGTAVLFGRRLEYREHEVGYCLARAAWGKGLASEILAELLRFGFEDLGAHRIYASVDPDNLASCRVLERHGLRLEGTQRRDSLKRGEWFDSHIYALLAEEWSVRREAVAQDRVGGVA